MKLAEALSIARNAPASGREYSVFLACGFTPLHLQNFLVAHLQSAFPDRKVVVTTGLYDDLVGTVESWASHQEAPVGAVLIEWADLDPRLGFRSLGGWGQRVAESVLDRAEVTLERLWAGIAACPSSSKIAISLPTLPLPPAFHTVGWQASKIELALEEAVARFAREISAIATVSVLNRQELASVSAPDKRHDFRSDLYSGFPYTISHADALAAGLATLLRSGQPKKGLITDLDDTLWLGLVGEIGHDRVAWDLAGHAQIHGLYQQLLQALADHGVLVAVASKNSLEVADKALSRTDLAISREKIFPIEIHWEPKSQSVQRILDAWNISADSVIFVDDSPMELEEVRNAHPGIECILFPKSDHAAALAVLRRLRDLFGKHALSDEDAFRLESIRRGRQFAAPDTNGHHEQFLASAEAVITIQYDPPATDKRVVELVNKTNQFNLNGRRYTEAEWQSALQCEGSFSEVVSYSDKFGPLGKIGVLRGQIEGRSLRLETWVMSCRAFSRRIEYQCLAQLFQRFEVDTVIFDFEETPKNAPTRDFLSAIVAGSPAENAALTRRDFTTRCPQLYHKVLETNG